VIDFRLVGGLYTARKEGEKRVKTTAFLGRAVKTAVKRGAVKLWFRIK
jgi:hypothetical protein